MKGTSAVAIVVLAVISAITLMMTYAASRELPIVQTASLPVIDLPEYQAPKPPERTPVVKVSHARPAKRISSARAKPVDSLKVVEIRVIVANQRLFATLSDKKMREFPCSTADTNKRNRDGTPVTNVFGAFTAVKKDADHWSGEHDCPMPYSIFFTRSRAIHATEPKNYPALGNYPSSHGCVRVSYEDARWLYQHTPLGTPVSVE